MTTNQLKRCEIVKIVMIRGMIQKLVVCAQIREIHDCHNCSKKITALTIVVSKRRHF